VTEPCAQSTRPVGSAEQLATEPYDWVDALRTPGPVRDDALRRLHALLVRAAYRQVRRMHVIGGPDEVEQVANQAADEALVAVLGKLGTFEGRSRFTTWAYKFAVLQAGVEVRRRQWQHREVPLERDALIVATSPEPGLYAEASDLAAAVRRAIDEALSAHQRRIIVALVVDEVPIDVLAERLGSTRGAVYKTLHDARVRLRSALISGGYLTSEKGNR
jgi:RNA polymerase sigma-70 factor (ECF subfamily)